MKRHLLFFAGLISLCASAQVYVCPGGTVFVGGKVYIKNNLIDAGTVQNSGTITLGKDLIVTGGYTSTGTERFSGTTTQTITGTLSGTNYLGYVDKANGGTGTLALDNDIDVDSIVFSTNGVINASGKIVKVKSGMPTAIKGYNPLRYIRLDDNDGAVTRMFSQITRYAFPIGNPIGGYMRIDIDVTNLGATGPAYVTAMTLTNAGTINYDSLFVTGFLGSFPGICTPGSNAQVVQFNCLVDNYWSFNGPNDYRYTVYGYVNPCGTSPRRVVWSEVTLRRWTENVINVWGSLTDALCTYSDWTGIATEIPGGPYLGMTKDFGTAAGNTYLPVELLGPVAKAIDNDHIRVTWKTLNEKNNQGFTVQRSTNGVVWNDYAWIDGHGNSNQEHDYGLNDYDVTPNIDYYYRLAQQDYNGRVTFSHIVSAKIIGIDAWIGTVYPNPSSDQQFIDVSLPFAQPIDMYIYTLQGLLMSYQKIQGIEGMQKITLPSYDAETYVLQLVMQQQKATRKFIIIK